MNLAEYAERILKPATDHLAEQIKAEDPIRFARWQRAFNRRLKYRIAQAEGRLR